MEEQQSTNNANITTTSAAATTSSNSNSSSDDMCPLCHNALYYYDHEYYCKRCGYVSPKRQETFGRRIYFDKETNLSNTLCPTIIEGSYIGNKYIANKPTSFAAKPLSLEKLQFTENYLHENERSISNIMPLFFSLRQINIPQEIIHDMINLYIKYKRHLKGYSLAVIATAICYITCANYNIPKSLYEIREALKVVASNTNINACITRLFDLIYNNDSSGVDGDGAGGGDGGGGSINNNRIFSIYNDVNESVRYLINKCCNKFIEYIQSLLLSDNVAGGSSSNIYDKDSDAIVIIAKRSRRKKASGNGNGDGKGNGKGKEYHYRYKDLLILINKTQRKAYADYLRFVKENPFLLIGKKPSVIAAAFLYIAFTNLLDGDKDKVKDDGRGRSSSSNVLLSRVFSQLLVKTLHITNTSLKSRIKEIKAYMQSIEEG
ncbi:MAG: hypothetical protein QXF17_01425 [Ignisphaera sp.]